MFNSRQLQSGGSMSYYIGTEKIQGQFILNNIQYPSNWLEFSTQEERDALGIYWQDEPPPTLEETKAIAHSRIHQGWQNAIRYGKLTSNVVSGFEIDARRFEENQDKDNMTGKIERVERGIEQEPIYWKGVSEIRVITLAELKAMRDELTDYGNDQYMKKFTLMAQIEACTTIEECNQIVW